MRAVASLQSALECAKQAGGCVSLWRQLADAALGAENWLVATQALQHCLCHWPQDPLLLRAQVRSAQRLGDLPRCQKALQQLAAVDGLSEQEQWLQQRLKRRFEVSCSTSDREADWEADYEAVQSERRQRRRLGTAWSSEGHCLMKLNPAELLETVRAMASRVPSFRPVYFYISREDGRPVETKEDPSSALIESFRAMPPGVSKWISLLQMAERVEVHGALASGGLGLPLAAT